MERKMRRGIVPNPTSDGSRRGVLLFLLLPALLLAASEGEASGPLSRVDTIPCHRAVPECRELVALGGGQSLPVFRTHPLSETNPSVVRAVIVVHGDNRNAHFAFETMFLAASWARVQDSTLIVSPHFQLASDGPGSNDATWTSRGWKRGTESNRLVPDGPTVSSYAAVDRIIRTLGDSTRFPNLGAVVVAGHSAGGQYVHRFAATSPVEDELPHLRFRYVVANPSTYLYIGPERATGDVGGFEIPDQRRCPDYDEWHYGLRNRAPYALRLTEEQLRDRLLNRDVLYLVGTGDVGTEALDMVCGAMLQGERRYHRGLNFFAYLNAFFPQHEHRLFEVPDVGHSSEGIYISAMGLESLFGRLH
jgi:pimeloyl-ACP methyl ester carboxylesterase